MGIAPLLIHLISSTLPCLPSGFKTFTTYVMSLITGLVICSSSSVHGVPDKCQSSVGETSVIQVLRREESLKKGLGLVLSVGSQ